MHDFVSAGKNQIGQVFECVLIMNRLQSAKREQAPIAPIVSIKNFKNITFLLFLIQEKKELFPSIVHLSTYMSNLFLKRNSKRKKNNTQNK